MESVNRLLECDLMLGTLAKEAIECHEKGMHSASLACLFIFVEQRLKMCLERTEGNFNRLIHIAAKEKLISAEEFAMLDKLRQLRNSLFHESHYAWSYEKAGISYPLSEENTKTVIFRDFSHDSFT